MGCGVCRKPDLIDKEKNTKKYMFDFLGSVVCYFLS